MILLHSASHLAGLGIEHGLKILELGIELRRHTEPRLSEHFLGNLGDLGLGHDVHSALEAVLLMSEPKLAPDSKCALDSGGRPLTAF